ncbi:MAG: ATP-binding protein, partial [Alphaproteobacteria bacterium]|nr:ATP-binding protein [Alphaproteobacteria bacterium]
MNEVLGTLAVTRDEDLVAVRQQARDVALSLGFDVHDQTRIATALSEIARNALAYAGGGRIEFSLDGATDAHRLVVRVADQGPGIAALDDILDGTFRSPSGPAQGILATRRLMDHFHIETSPGRGTCVTIAKRLPRGQRAPTREIARLVATGARRPSPTAAGELQVQERELLMHLSELRSREEEVAALTAELESTNRGVVALYAELDERAEQLRQASELKSRFLSHMSHEFRTPL